MCATVAEIIWWWNDITTERGNTTMPLAILWRGIISKKISQPQIKFRLKHIPSRICPNSYLFCDTATKCVWGATKCAVTPLLYPPQFFMIMKLGTPCIKFIKDWSRRLRLQIWILCIGSVLAPDLDFKHRIQIRVLCIGSRYKFYVLDPDTSFMYWIQIRVLCIGSRYEFYVLDPDTSFMYWIQIRVLCIGSRYEFYVLDLGWLALDLMYWIQVHFRISILQTPY
jgi:hypothetical protein